MTDEQLALDTCDDAKRTRYRPFDTATGEWGKPFTAEPTGCMTCAMHGKRNRLPEVVLLGSKRWGGVAYCPAHGEHEAREVRARLAAEAARRAVYQGEAAASEMFGFSENHTADVAEHTRHGGR